jgi:hypothetical protein
MMKYYNEGHNAAIDGLDWRVCPYKGSAQMDARLAWMAGYLGDPMPSIQSNSVVSSNLN